MLNLYQNQTTALLTTTIGGTLFNSANITMWINEARQQIALRAQCVRCLSPVSGPLSSIQITTPGSGYTSAPNVIITGPDFPSGYPPSPFGIQAYATAVLSGAQLSSVTINSGGTGYFAPGISFSGGGAAVEATAISYVSSGSITQCQQGQEQYPFSAILQAIQSPTSNYSGIQQVVGVKSVAFIWGTFRYVRLSVGFSKYQALVRTYAQSYQDVPSIVAQYGQGVNGTLFFYPIPNNNYQFEADSFCLPADLVDDNTYEAIPVPWQVCVQYYAAAKALESVGRFADAKMYYNDAKQSPGRFQQLMATARAGSEPGQASNWYGRL